MSWAATFSWPAVSGRAASSEERFRDAGSGTVHSKSGDSVTCGR